MKLEDLPTYIRSHASYASSYTPFIADETQDIFVSFPWGSLKIAEDFKEQPAAKKWLKKHGGCYMSLGYWLLLGVGPVPSEGGQ